MTNHNDEQVGKAVLAAIDAVRNGADAARIIAILEAVAAGQPVTIGDKTLPYLGLTGRFTDRDDLRELIMRRAIVRQWPTDHSALRHGLYDAEAMVPSLAGENPYAPVVLAVNPGFNKRFQVLSELVSWIVDGQKALGNEVDASALMKRVNLVYDGNPQWLGYEPRAYTIDLQANRSLSVEEAFCGGLPLAGLELLLLLAQNPHFTAGLISPDNPYGDMIVGGLMVETNSATQAIVITKCEGKLVFELHPYGQGRLGAVVPTLQAFGQ